MNNKLSVVVPVYRVEKFLNKCVDSIIAQTYKNLEIILVDDGSPDNCPSICDEYARKDERVRVIHKKNGGLSSARNAGLQAATGGYVAFVDSDDWIRPTMYEELMYLAEDLDADVVSGAFFTYKEHRNPPICEGGADGKVRIMTNAEALSELYFGNQGFFCLSTMVPTKIYRTELAKKVEFPEGFIHEDVYWTPMILHMADRVVMYNKSFYAYNLESPTSISSQGRTINAIEGSLHSAKSVCEYFNQNRLETISDYTERKYYSSIIECYYECWMKRKESVYDQKMRELKKETFNNKKTC